VISLNAEHGHIRVVGSGKGLARGAKLELLPAHADTTVFFHNNYVVTRGEEVEMTLEIPCRGRLD